MKNLFYFLLIFVFIFRVQSQQAQIYNNFNFDLEKSTSGKPLPDGWFVWGKDYGLAIDSTTIHQGKYSVKITAPANRTDGSFGCIAYQVPAHYSGKVIELKAYIKMQNVKEGPIGLLIRIDGTGGTLQFDNMQEKNIQGTSDWTLYSVKVPYPENAKTIFIGALLSGTGEIWVDDFQLFIDGKDIKTIEPEKKPVLKADLDKEFDKGSGIDNITLTDRKIEDLRILGLVWGFLKYYHPSIAKGDYNWDYELFRQLPDILNSKDQKERDIKLSNWIESLGTFDELKNDSTINSGIVKMTPDLDWIENSGLSKHLQSVLLKVKNAKRDNNNYYIGLNRYVGNPEFTNERSYETMLYPDAGFRLLNLYRYWNMIQYYFPYKYLIEEDWKDVLTEFIPKSINATSELEYTLTTLELITRICDTHANIYGDNKSLNAYWGEKYAPYQLRFVEGKPIVTNSFKKDQNESSELQVGDIITAINTRQIDEIINEHLKYTPASNYPTQLKNIATNLLASNDSILQISFLRGNKAMSATVKTYSTKEINVYNTFPPDSCYQKIGNDIGYIYAGKFKNSDLKRIMNTAADTKGLIVDLRCYPSDFMVFSLGGYLVKEKTDFVRFTSGSIRQPGLFKMGEIMQITPDSVHHYNGKVVILVNENTLSQAEYTTMALQSARNSIVIGSTTAAADGNISPLFLVGNIRSLITGIGVYYPDGKETQRIGIIPDIEVRPTIKGIREGRDEVLEKAIEVINN